MTFPRNVPTFDRMSIRIQIRVAEWICEYSIIARHFAKGPQAISTRGDKILYRSYAL